MYMYLCVIQFGCSYYWGKLNSTDVTYSDRFFLAIGVNSESAKYPPWFKISRIEKQMVGERIRFLDQNLLMVQVNVFFFLSGSDWIVTEILRLRLR